jgi:hypothetical protein
VKEIILFIAMLAILAILEKGKTHITAKFAIVVF